MAEASRQKGETAWDSKAHATTDGDDTGSTTSTHKDDFLKVTREGCFGALERIPLWIKLMVTIGVFAAGMIVIGGLLINSYYTTIATAKSQAEFEAKASDLGTLISACQNERDKVNTAIYTSAANPNATTTQLYDTYNETNAVIARFVPVFSKYTNMRIENASSYLTDVRINASVQAYNNLLLQLDEYRTSAVAKSAGGPTTFTYYSGIISPLLSILALFSSAASSPNTASLLAMTQLSELQLQVKTSGYSMIASGKKTIATVALMGQYIKTRDQLSKQALSGAPDDVAQIYETTVVQISSNTLTSYEGFLMAPLPPNQPSQVIPANAYSSSVWLAESDRLYNATVIASNYLKNKIANTAAVNVASATYQIVGITILTVGLFLLGVASAFIMSNTITGPWRRVNELQSSLMSLFVPQKMLRMMGIKRFDEIKLGLCQEVKVSVLTIIIRNYENLKQSMKSNDLFEFTSNFTGDFGPIIEKYHGDIHDFGEDRLVAVFTSSINAVAAASDIHDRVEMYRKGMVTAMPIPLGVSLHSEKALIGTVGDKNHLRVAVVPSNPARISALEKVSMISESGPVTTLKPKKVLSPFKKSLTGYRPIGRMRDSTPLLEILPPRESNDTDNTFGMGLALYEGRRYKDADKKFKKLNDPSDKVLAFYKRRAADMVELYHKRSREIRFNDIIEDEVLYRAFRDKCQAESSLENLDFWSDIRRYKKMSSFDERVVLADTMKSEYLIPDAEREVNLTDNEKKELVTMIESRDLQDDSFKKAQCLIELVIGGDTLSRFAESGELTELLIERDAGNSHAYIDDGI